MKNYTNVLSIIIMVFFFTRSLAIAGTNDSYVNHLINEKSPYLLQHAYNPVDWYPWGKEAFEKAERALRVELESAKLTVGK